MTPYAIPESLIDTHDGPEWASAALMGNRVVALLYLSDIAADLARNVEIPAAELLFRRWAHESAPDFLHLQALGDVSAGLVTAEGFIEHWRLAEWKPSDQLPVDWA